MNHSFFGPGKKESTKAYKTVIRDSYFWALISPLSFIIDGGWSHLRNHALRAWGYGGAWVPFDGRPGRSAAGGGTLRLRTTAQTPNEAQGRPALRDLTTWLTTGRRPNDFLGLSIHFYSSYWMRQSQSDKTVFALGRSADILIGDFAGIKFW